MTDLEQLQLIRSRTLQQIADLRADPKPSYSIDGQWVAWTAYVEALQQTVDWCDHKLVGAEPFEIVSRGIVEQIIMECATAGDLNYFDHLEPVRVAIGAATFDVSALRRPLTAMDADAPESHRANWHIEASALATDPTVGSTITTLSPGLDEVWTVEHADRVTLGARWKLRCMLS